MCPVHSCQNCVDTYMLVYEMSVPINAHHVLFLYCISTHLAKWGSWNHFFFSEMPTFGCDKSLDSP